MSQYSICPENVIDHLRTLASRDFQKVAWFKNDKGLCYSYGENISDLFDDYDLEKILYTKDEIIFSKEADQALRELNKVVDKVGYNKPEHKIIDTPEMKIVRQKAAKVLELVESTDGSESTVDYVEAGTTDTFISLKDALMIEPYWAKLIA
ncbi:MAG: hypothetical protein MK052_04190 [Alphaproteobacteria bacterium]|nr:hypothetical protein [Alphaproteobacteria bacterium]